MCVSHSVPDGKLDVSDRGRVPFRASLRGWPTRDGVQTPKVSKPANTGGGDDDGVGGHGAAGDTDRIERVYLDGNHAYRFTHDYNGPYWRAEWWAQVPVSKRGAQLRDTRDGERPNDVDFRRQRWSRGRAAGAKVGHRKLTGVPEAEVAGLSNEKVTETSETRLPNLDPN
jgi:hypothetical protein